MIEFLSHSCPTTPFTVGDNTNDVESIQSCGMCVGGA